LHQRPLEPLQAGEHHGIVRDLGDGQRL
jgi:hypothetical protein